MDDSIWLTDICQVGGPEVTKNKEKTQDGTRPASSKSADQAPHTLVGIEVDGTEVHVAYVEANGTVRVEHFRDQTSAKALDAALKAIPSRSEIVRVAFTGGRQYVRRVEVPRVPERAMRAAMMAVAEENLPIVPGAASVAGLIIGNPNEGRDASDPRGASSAINMVIAAVESDDLDPVWRRLGGRRAPITSASFLLPADGLYLRVARATSEMIILRGGVPLLSRALRVGGLDELERRIYASEQAGFNPSFDGTGETSDAGKSAAEITDSYLDELVGDFRKTLIFWKREGTEVPADIIVLGAGATIPTLLTRVRDAGFNVSPVPEPRGVHMAMADHQKPVAFQALAAAYSDFSQQPYAILPNPVYDAQLVAQERRAKQRKMFLVGTVVIATVLALAILPLGYAKGKQALANSGKEDAENSIVQYQDLIEKNDQLTLGESAVEVLETGVPAYTKIVCSVLSSSPEGLQTTFKSLTIASSDTGPTVDTSVEVKDPAQGFQVFGDWQERLKVAVSAQTPLNTNQITVGSFKFNPDSQTKDSSFRWSTPFFEAYKVPNIDTCDGYVGGLSESQRKKVEAGLDANDSTVEFNGSGELVYVANGKPVSPTTTTLPDSAKKSSTTASEDSVSTQGGDQ